jgi:hypothetical protein
VSHKPTGKIESIALWLAFPALEYAVIAMIGSPVLAFALAAVLFLFAYRKHPKVEQVIQRIRLTTNVAVFLAFCIFALIGIEEWWRIHQSVDKFAGMGGALAGFGADEGPWCLATIDGRKLMPVHNNYDFVVICGLTDLATDKFRQTDISMSRPFEITPALSTVRFPHSASMTLSVGRERVKTIRENMARIPANADRVNVRAEFWYALMLIPKNSNLGELHSLADAQVHGELLALVATKQTF